MKLNNLIFLFSDCFQKLILNCVISKWNIYSFLLGVCLPRVSICEDVGGEDEKINIKTFQ